jgi:hypothetical protein
MNQTPNTTAGDMKQNNQPTYQENGNPSALEDREFIKTCYRHFNALAMTYKKQLDKLDERDK